MLKNKANLVFSLLKGLYPQAHCELNHRNAFELLVATILSAQCTDKRVNMVTPVLFEKYPSSKELSQASLEDLKQIIYSTGFYNNKAKNLIAMAKDLELKHQGQVPNDLEKLTHLAGVGRKTANVVLSNFYGVPAMVVDTHVSRISRLIGFTDNLDPVKIEQDLMKIFEPHQWCDLSHLLIWHGRSICIANRPKCDRCPLVEICNYGRSLL